MNPENSQVRGQRSENRGRRAEVRDQTDADGSLTSDLRPLTSALTSNLWPLPSVLNRDFQHPDDGWYMIEPRGEHPNAAAGIVQVIDDQAVQNIVSDFNAKASAPNFPGMLVDHEHFSHDQDKETRAFGWLNKLAARPDGIYGQIRWTDTGRAAVDGGDYRFFSTEYAAGDLKQTETVNGRNGESAPSPSRRLADSPPRLRPARLAGLTLTNKPNNKGGKPITNREEEETGKRRDGETAMSPVRPFSVSPVRSKPAQNFADPASAASAANPKTQDPKPKTQAPKHMQTIATKLGLAAEASEEAILAEVTKIMNRANEATAELDSAKKTVTTLEGQLTAFKETQADSDLEPVKNKLKPEQLTVLRTQLINNREITLPLLEIVRNASAAEAAASNPDLTCPKCGHKFPGQSRNRKAESRNLLTNRDDAQTPADRRGALPGDQAIRVAVDEYRVKNRCSFAQAWEAVKHEKPDLFKQEV